MINDLIFFFIFFGGFMSWTIALGLIFEKNRHTYHYLFAAFMFCLGTLQILDGLLVTGKLATYSYLIFWYLPFMAYAGPTFFFSFKAANSDSFRFTIADLRHFVFGLLTAILLIPLVRLDGSVKMSFIMQTPNFSNGDPLFRLYSGLFTAAILYIIGYQVYFFIECRSMLDIKLIREKKVSPYLMIILLFCFSLEIVFFICMIMMSFIKYPQMLFIGVIQALTALSFLLTLAIFIMEKRDINFFKLIFTEIENIRYEKSKLKNLDVETLLARIQTLMDIEKIFRDDDLSVGGLAQRLSIEPYQLSQLINENYNNNFKNFINKYRIDEAKKILLNERDRTITSVAYAVGFNSTTVFYEWFNRFTGISPTEFRSKNQKDTELQLETAL